VFYSYFYGECFMWVTVAETPSGPQGEVTLVGIYGEQPRHKPFRISRAEFEDIWSTLNAPGVVKRVIRPGEKGLGNSYIFDDGEQKFAVQKSVRSYGWPLMPAALNNLPRKAAASSVTPMILFVA
jgi:hypothetical protein